MTETKPAATVTSTTVRKTYQLSLVGCDPRPVPSRRPDRIYRPQYMTVERTNGNLASVILRGAVIKKDGTDGQQEATERLWRRGDWPSWVESIVGGLA